MSNEIILEGEYKNGKRNGKGKEYNRYGDIIFKGEYLNGKKWNGYGNKCDNSKFYQIINGKGNVNESNWRNYFLWRRICQWTKKW